MTIPDQIRTRAARAVGHLLGAYDPDEQPRPESPLVPHTANGRFTFSHYNVVIPDLPEPHRHLACLALVGRSGSEVFDHDDIVAGTPANTATLSIGTAATGTGWFETYDIRSDCDLRADGTHIRFGSDLTITGTFPTYEITIDRPGLRIELVAQCTGQVTWFARSRIYQHVGYPARYEGTLTHEGETQAISGVLSLEHALLWSLTALRDRNIPAQLKLPWNFFSYHVIQLSPDTTLMLAATEVFTQPSLVGAWLKQLDGRSERWVSGEVTFEEIDHQREPRVAADGFTLHLPHHFRWRIHDTQGEILTEINGTTDADAGFVYGIGKGWIGGYSYSGTHKGSPVSGTAYMEYARTR